MNNKISVIIPALDKNRYSDDGDLAMFGEVSLLEWKIVQLKRFVELKDVYVTTPSDRVAAVAERCGVNIVRREDNATMRETVCGSLDKVKTDDILWTHVTSPFVSASNFERMLRRYEGLMEDYDCLVAVHKINEYIVYKGKALNYDIEGLKDRSDIEPIYRITNGCFITTKDVCRKHGRYLGVRPYLYQVDKIASHEINDTESLQIMSELISLYVRQDLDV